MAKKEEKIKSKIEKKSKKGYFSPNFSFGDENSKNIIEFKNISYIYGAGTPFQISALDDINFGIERGKITGIIGHTGSGKSTLVQHMNGLLKPTTGTVLINDTDMWSDKNITRASRFKVGLVFQYPENQLFEETIEKEIAYGPRNMGLPDDEIRERVYSATKFVGLHEEILKKSPFELSGGQMRRVAIASVMSMKPQLLVLDEPAAGLDPMGREEILGGICAYKRESGTTVVIVSHSMEDMARYAENVVVMRGSKIIADGSVHSIFSNEELLVNNGLSSPQITKLMKKIAALGIPVREDIFTIEDAKKELLSHFAKIKEGK